MVRRLDTTWLRICNLEYLRENGSCGLSTLRKHHVQPQGDTVWLLFAGKSGVCHEARLEERRVARLVRRCQDLPSQALFSYVGDDGALQTVESTNVNAWPAEAAGTQLTAKDFRTWHGSVQALALAVEPRQRSAADGRGSSAVVAAVAERLGNTPAVCRKAYIHPRVLDLLNTLAEEGHAELTTRRWVRHRTRGHGLSVDERRLLGLMAVQRHHRGALG